MKPQKVEISYKTIIFTVLFLLSLKFLWDVRNIITLLFVGFIFMEAINPYVRHMEKLKIPRTLGILIVYAIILAVVSFAVAGIVPLLIEQTAGLIDTLPRVLQDINLFGASAIDLSSQFRILENLPANIAKTVLSIFSNIFSAFVISVVTFYLLIERKNFEKYSFDMFGEDGRKKFIEIINRLEERLGRWVNAEFFLMTIIGLVSYIGFTLLGLNYTVPLAIIAGLLEVVPNIGPVISTTIAAVVGLTISPLTALLTIGWGILVQQLENNIIVPKIMKETVGLNPLITIVLLITGAKLGGVVGAILAVPLYITIEVIIKVIFNKPLKSL